MAVDAEKESREGDGDRDVDVTSAEGSSDDDDGDSASDGERGSSRGGADRPGGDDDGRGDDGQAPCGHTTNFSISEILKPSFGSCKRKRTFDVVVGFSLFASSAAGRELKAGAIEAQRCGQADDRSPDDRDAKRAYYNVESGKLNAELPWPAWVYCTRYSDRPSAGPRSRKSKKSTSRKPEEKRPRTAFSADQLNRLRSEFDTDKYLTEERRLRLAHELQLNDAQIKIWFQNKRAKLKKASGVRHPLAEQLLAQGLYNHRASSHSSAEDH